jgi:hypothetical protein
MSPEGTKQNEMIHLGAPFRKPFKTTAKSIKDAPFHKTANPVDEIKIL